MTKEGTKELKRVLVIGANSFSGSDFIDLLLEREEYQVLGISRSSQKRYPFLPKSMFDSPNFSFRKVDINRELHKFVFCIEKFRPDYVVNFAAQSEVGPSWERPWDWYQTNAVGLTQIAHFLKDQKYLKKYVHISSPEVYGSCVGRVDEESPLNPSTPYAASKAAGDLSLQTYLKNFDFPLVTVRATNVYGPRQQLFKIIPRSVIYLKSGTKIELHGGGSAAKSYIHIRDVSRGELAVMEQGKIGEIYHLSPKRAISIKEVVSMTCQHMKKDFEHCTVVAEERLGQDAKYEIVSEKAQSELKWEPQITFEKGLKEVINWVEENWGEIQKEPLEYVHKP